MLIAFLCGFVFVLQGVVFGIQFSPVASWVLNASLSDASTGTTYYIWKPICQGGYAIGDFMTNINYQSSGGTPPTTMLFCAIDTSGTITAATNFTTEGTFKNLMASNATWEVAQGSTPSSQYVPGYLVLPAPPTPTSSGIPTLTITLSLGLSLNSLKRSTESELSQSTSTSNSVIYGAFPNSTCFQPCQYTVATYSLPSLGYNFIIFNPFEYLGAFTANATLFIINTNTTSVPFCLTTECVCGPCDHGGQCNQYGACICPPQWNGTSCDQPVDMCALHLDNCDPHTTCISYPGGYNCTPCPSGYDDVYNNGTLCLVSDECLQYGQANCSNYGLNCTNYQGSFICVPCPNGYINISNNCTPYYCENARYFPNVTTDLPCNGGYGCNLNCTCASGYEPTNPPSANCTTLCGNGQINPGEECDGGVGCDSTCHCDRLLGYVPYPTPSVNCTKASFTYFDSCELYNRSCSECINFNCLYCVNSSICQSQRISLDCQTICPSFNNSALQAPSSTPSNFNGVLISILVVAGVLVIGALVLVIILRLHRKKRKQKKVEEVDLLATTTQRSRYGVLTYTGSLLSVTKEWTPPTDSTFVKLNKLPIKFSKPLDFNIGMNQFQVKEPYVDVIALSLKDGRKDEVNVEFHPSINPRYELIVEPQSVVVKKGKEVDVKFILTVTMTTEVECPIGINLPHEKIHSKIIVNIVSQLSPFIDFDELVMDSQKPIGDGGFGRVYRGQYRGTDAAIKVLKVQDLPEELLEEFGREIDLMAKLRHKNIVQFLGASCVQGKFAIVTEFIELGSVSNFMKKEKLSYALKLKIACDAARALSFLHKNKIIHRDLKLDNLLLVSTSLSAPVNAKLSDFGTARAVSEKTSNNYTTGIGTPLYMAPEILKREPYDLRSDIYSFGMLLWALMAEREPWSQYTQAWEIANLVIEGKREVISPDWPSEIAELIRRCWAENPNERPETKEVYQILHEITIKELEKYSVDSNHASLIASQETPRINNTIK
jgi:tRNA A-37 threonylcarbamoyl transferase component Bud32